MAGRRGYEDEQLEDSATESDYPWNQWYSYPTCGYYPYGAARMSPHCQWSRAQCGIVANRPDSGGTVPTF